VSACTFGAGPCCGGLLLLQVLRSVEQQGGMLLGVHLQALLHLYKARLAMVCNNFKAAKKEV